MTETEDKFSSVMIKAIDDEIRTYKALIEKLEEEKKKYMNQYSGKESLLAKKPHSPGHHVSKSLQPRLFIDLSRKTRKSVIIETIGKTEGKFDSGQIYDAVVKEVGEMSKENFFSVFSRLKSDGIFKDAGEREDGRKLYERLSH